MHPICWHIQIAVFKHSLKKFISASAALHSKLVCSSGAQLQRRWLGKLLPCCWNWGSSLARAGENKAACNATRGLQGNTGRSPFLLGNKKTYFRSKHWINTIKKFLCCSTAVGAATQTSPESCRQHTSCTHLVLYKIYKTYQYLLCTFESRKITSPTN